MKYPIKAIIFGTLTKETMPSFLSSPNLIVKDMIKEDMCDFLQLERPDAAILILEGTLFLLVTLPSMQ